MSVCDPLRAETSGSMSIGRYGSRELSLTGTVRHSSTNRSFICCLWRPLWRLFKPTINQSISLHPSVDKTIQQYIATSIPSRTGMLIQKSTIYVVISLSKIRDCDWSYMHHVICTNNHCWLVQWSTLPVNITFAADFWYEHYVTVTYFAHQLYILRCIMWLRKLWCNCCFVSSLKGL